MHTDTYEVTCRRCKGHARLTITSDRTVFYIDHMPIISARFRPDLKWGFECGACGNDSRMAPMERKNIDVLVKGSGMAKQRILDSMKEPSELKFVMERV